MMRTGLRIVLALSTGLAIFPSPQFCADQPFEVLVSEPWTVHSSPSGGGTWMLRLAGGQIVNQYWERGGETQYGLLSTDRGKTWARTAWPGDSACLGVLSDGTVLALAYMKNVRKIAPGRFLYPRWVSRDHWKTWEGPFDTHVSIPNATGGTGDDMKPFNGPLFWRSLLELPDHSLLATMYGYFEGDTVPISGFKRVEGFNKYRTLLVESRDRGASWTLVSTIAYDPAAGQEGFCEPALARLPDGELVCIMRTGYTHDPMHVARSRDGGRSWTRPVSTGLTGVDPRLVVLGNGLVACAYGVKEYDGNRRERRLMFSRDGGRTWSHNTIVFAGYDGSYPDAVELEPGKLLYVWDADGFKEPGDSTRPRNYLRITTITIRPVDQRRPLIPFPIVR